MSDTPEGQPGGESEATREARVRMEIARREMEMRMRASPAAREGREGRGEGHGAKAGLRGATALLVVLAVLASLWILQRASRKLDLDRSPDPRPLRGR